MVQTIDVAFASGITVSVIAMFFFGVAGYFLTNKEIWGMMIFQAIAAVICIVFVPSIIPAVVG